MKRGEYDPTVKVMVEAGPVDWVVLDGQPADPSRVIDADLSAVSASADKVILVEAAEPYLYHLEFQTGHDGKEVPRRLNTRSSLLEERHQMLTRSVAVLLRPEADSPELTGVFERGFKGVPPYRVFRYDVIRVWQLDVDRLLTGGLGTLAIAPLAKVTEKELPGVIAEMGRRLEKEATRPKAAELWNATQILMGLRFPADMTAKLLQGVRHMKDSVTYQAIVAEGVAEGVVKGIQRSILGVGSEKFGPASKKTRSRITKITDAKDLDALLVRIVQVNTWDELFADTPAPARRTSRLKQPEDS